jgi:ubiquinol-cytochrome c reductase iron-sulfur subunit
MDGTRRDFLYVASGAMAAVGAAAAAWPFIDQMNPSAAALALSTVEVDRCEMARPSAFHPSPLAGRN